MMAVRNRDLLSPAGFGGDRYGLVSGLQAALRGGCLAGVSGGSVRRIWGIGWVVEEVVTIVWSADEAAIQRPAAKSAVMVEGLRAVSGREMR
jgi:hypothetical protein